MKSAFLLFTLALLICLAPLVPALAAKPAAKTAPLRPTITVHATASVSDTYFTLGEIADIKGGDPNFAARLAAAPMGRAPIPGTSRPLDTGDIVLKLRQSGIDPATVCLAGATTVQITCSGDGASSAAAGSTSSPGASPASGQNNTTVVHAGDAVNLVYIDGRITISARAYAMQNGAAGDTITLRRDGAAHTFEGTVLDSETVQLED